MIIAYKCFTQDMLTRIYEGLQATLPGSQIHKTHYKVHNNPSTCVEIAYNV